MTIEPWIDTVFILNGDLDYRHRLEETDDSLWTLFYEELEDDKWVTKSRCDFGEDRLPFLAKMFKEAAATAAAGTGSDSLKEPRNASPSR